MNNKYYTALNKVAFWDIRYWQLLTGTSLVVLAGVVYWFTLMLNTSFSWNPWDQTLINFGLKGLWLLPFYGLLFVWLAGWPLKKVLWLHLICAPAYVLLWLWSYHLLADGLGIGYMTGQAMVWDIFIPLLLYIIPFSIIHAYKYYTRLQAEREASHQLRELAFMSDINALKAQMQPHFLFNTLNAINASLPPEQEQTRMLIAQLADTFRYALRSSLEPWVPLQDEIDFVQSYLQIEQHRFADRLSVHFEIDEQAYRYKVPSLLLQPLVENAVRHGAAPCTDAVHITIKVQLDATALIITITDTGAGLPEHTTLEQLLGKGVGLGNTYKRVKKQFNTNVTIGPNQPAGVVVRMALPIQQLPYA